MDRIQFDAYSAILEASKQLGHSLEPEIAINSLLKLLADSLDLKKGRIVLPGKSGKLHIRYSFGLSDEERLRGVYDIGEGVTGNVIMSGNVAVVQDVTKEPLFLARVNALAELQKEMVAYIAVPIIQDDEPVGVLAVHPARKNMRGHKTNIELLEIFASMIGQVLKINELMERKKAEMEMEFHETKTDANGMEVAYGIIGSSPAFNKAVKKAKRAASSNAAVMLAGESGVGKERFARLIHFESERRDRPFVCVNCAAIPDNLLESELFGHEKGSFTGATSLRRGKFEYANEGTLFLDEIADMNIDLQAKLLRILQEKRVQRVGSNEELSVDTRIICATNRNLDEAVNDGRFRMDLYYRLNVIKISLPALRQRREDILLFVSYFISRANQRYHKNISLTPRALNLLQDYDWPGNIRQLENFIERLVIMSENDLVKQVNIKSYLEDERGINISNLPQKTVFPVDGYNVMEAPDARPYQRVRQEDQQIVIDALQKSRGNKTQAAKLLGLSARQLHYRLLKLEIDC